MSDRPTPETDAAFRKGMNGKQVFEFAERLERERDEAREALAEAWRFADQWLALADGYLKRINEIQNDIQKN
jgi:uncharacterized protein YllA (UPF0747 family)